MAIIPGETTGEAWTNRLVEHDQSWKCERITAALAESNMCMILTLGAACSRIGHFQETTSEGNRSASEPRDIIFGRFFDAPTKHSAIAMGYPWGCFSLNPDEDYFASPQILFNNVSNEEQILTCMTGIETRKRGSPLVIDIFSSTQCLHKDPTNFPPSSKDHSSIIQHLRTISPFSSSINITLDFIFSQL